jgi:hypothetical protein
VGSGDLGAVPGGEIYPAARSAQKPLMKNSPEQRAANGGRTRQRPFQKKRVMTKTPKQKFSTPDQFFS